MSYALSKTVDLTYDEAVAATKAALADQGFGVLTEIDLKATLKAKIDADIPPQVILGACRPPLAKRAIEIDPSIGTLLPCNVVIREDESGSTLVEALDPATMVELTGNQALQEVAGDARERLVNALDSLPAGT
jgi:uncharacterized protein (DUF302 family)